MESFVMEIAGVPGAVFPAFSSTREYCKAYLSHGEPRFRVCVSPEERAAEQKLLNEEADREGLRRRVFTEPFLERAVLQRRFAQALLEEDTLLLHGSTVAADGKGYLFTADTGVGKSTHTRLWRQLLGGRAVMVNDDRTFLRFTPEGVLACGAPWSGKHGLDTNLCVPLAGICILERGGENRIVPLSAEEALPMLLRQAYVPYAENTSAVHALTRRLSAGVPLWRMTCTKDPAAAETAFRAMSSV